MFNLKYIVNVRCINECNVFGVVATAYTLHNIQFTTIDEKAKAALPRFSVIVIKLALISIAVCRRVQGAHIFIFQKR